MIWSFLVENDQTKGASGVDATPVAGLDETCDVVLWSFLVENDQTKRAGVGGATPVSGVKCDV